MKVALVGLVAVPAAILVGAVGLMGAVTPAALASTCTAGPVPAADGTPSILGGESLTALDIAAWWTRTSPGPDPSGTLGVDAETLAQDYLSAGADNGVRGDLAFAQAILETGAFTSSDARTRFNFAGIAHPDGATVGEAFSTVDQGVEAHVQLLREATGAPLGDLEPHVAPAWAGPRVATFGELTGTWASAPDYWTAVDRIWTSMLHGQVLAPGAPIPACGPAGPVSIGPLGTWADHWPTVLAFLEAQLGKAYVWGATGPDSFDCSGLVEAAFATIGVRLPRTSEEQYAATVGTAITPNSTAAIPAGSLLFSEGNPPGHVRVAIGGGLAIAAPYTGQVVRVEPIGPLSDLTAVTLPVPS